MVKVWKAAALDPGFRHPQHGRNGMESILKHCFNGQGHKSSCSNVPRISRVRGPDDIDSPKSPFTTSAEESGPLITGLMTMTTTQYDSQLFVFSSAI